MGVRTAPCAARLSRATLPQATLRRLQVGGGANPDVLLVEVEGERAIVKDYRPRGPAVRSLLGRWLLRREIRAYRALEGLPAVPRLLGVIDPLAILVEYRPGVRMSRRLAPLLRPEFVGELEAAVRALHARGVVHLDLRHRSNVMVDADGHPVLVDFASALTFRPGGIAARFLLPWLAAIDLRAHDKWRVRLGPQSARDGSVCGAGSEGGRGASRPT